MCQARGAKRSSGCADAGAARAKSTHTPCAIVRHVRRRVVTAVVILCIGWALAVRTAVAQERITIAADVLLYGDNTEFRNPFREGETLFGAAPRVSAIFDLGDRAALQLGIFANQRFGSDKASDLTRPIISVTLRSG